MPEPLDVTERAQLCDLLTSLGAGAPTLCEGWTTADLAAHLFLREHFHRSTPSRMAGEIALGYDRLISRIRAGAPMVPWRLPWVRNYVNGFEYFVHHEDVRRANGFEPPPEIPELEDLCWRTCGFLGRRLGKRLKGACLELGPLGQKRRNRRRFGSGPVAVLSGPPTELALYLSGRRSAAVVELSGDEAAVAAVERSDAKL